MKEKLILTMVIIFLMSGSGCLAAESDDVCGDVGSTVDVSNEASAVSEGIEENEAQNLLVELLVQLFDVDAEVSEEEAKEQVEELLSAFGQIITSTIQADVNSVVTARTEVNEYDLEGVITQKLEEAKEEKIETIDTECIDTCVTLAGLSVDDFELEYLYALVYADDLAYDTVLATFKGTWSEGKVVGGLTIGGTEKGIQKLVASLETLISGTATLTAYNEMNYEESEYGQLRSELSAETDELKVEVTELYQSLDIIVEFFGIDEWVRSLEFLNK